MSASKTLFLLLILGFCPFDVAAQESQVFDDLVLQSEILGKEKKFAIYLPPGYQNSDQSYPVIYLLHGAGSGDNKHQDWIKLGTMKSITDGTIASGEMPSTVIVMPDAEMTYYMNNADGNYQFEDFFMRELIPHIERNYRVKRDKSNRAIAGLSMGGFGALIYALHNPQFFSAAAGLSAAIRTDEQINSLSLEGYLQRYRVPMGNLKANDERITDFWNANSPLYLVRNRSISHTNSVDFYLDIGDEDGFVLGNRLFHEELQKRSAEHEYRVRPGKHNWEFWKTGLADALKFVSRNFN